ncbi:MAG: hypothetical protein Q9196_003567 [Gyalolechia fulgens]
MQVFAPLPPRHNTNSLDSPLSSPSTTQIIYLQHHLPRAGAHPPLRLAPIGGTAEFWPTTAEVASAAAKPGTALGVDNGTASITVTDNLGRGSRRSWGLLVEGAFAEATLAASTAVDGLILDLVAGSGGGSILENAGGQRKRRQESGKGKWSGQSTPLDPAGGVGRRGLAAIFSGCLEVVNGGDGKRTAQLEPVPEKDFWQVLGSQ